VVDCLSVTGSCPGENVAATGDAVDSTLLGPGLQIVIAGRLPPTLLLVNQHVAFPRCLFKSLPRHGSLPPRSAFIKARYDAVEPTNV
jgi:hypothetical protein